ncbi:MAG: 4Fe-4S cluster-binding domain-containing protein [candidate division WOR-3 bacterium]
MKQIIISNRIANDSEVPGFLVISPGSKCNLQCSDCYANSTCVNVSLDYDILTRIINETKNLWGTKFCVISGGEPFIYQSRGKTIIDLAKENQDVFFGLYQWHND